MTPELFTGFTWIMIKIMTIIGLIIYALYAGIIVRQERLMAHALKESSEPILRILSIIHLAAALFVLILAVFIL